MSSPPSWLTGARSRSVVIPSRSGLLSFLSPHRGLQLRPLPLPPSRCTPWGCSPDSGDSSGGGPCARHTARGEAEPGLASQSASGHSPLPSPVPEGSDHRLRERATQDNVSVFRAGAMFCLVHSSIPRAKNSGWHTVGAQQTFGK